MREAITKIMAWLRCSFEAEKGKASARKLSVFMVMLLVIMAHISWLKNAFLNDNYTLLEGILMIDYGFISVLLGLKTWEGIKNGKQPPT